jgi:hypothetical protein
MNRRMWGLLSANIQALLVLMWLSGIQIHRHDAALDDHEHLHAAHSDHHHHHEHDSGDAHGHHAPMPDAADPIPDEQQPIGDDDSHVHVGVESVLSLTATEPPSLASVSIFCSPLMPPDPQVLPDGLSVDIDTPPVVLL